MRWLRGGCKWLCVVEPIDGGAVPAWDQVPVDVDGHLNRTVPHLVAAVGGRREHDCFQLDFNL